ncbi:ATP-binding cassette domain-containing protein [Providencia rettgeri]|uniref:ATP-binding cassette domain-containing protein n=1 Tax=Providencia rettgeri TaxID=587 RepID=UPI00235E8211|nr:ABC transporter ATP-binding protein [Providencia rettgeri]
MLKSLLYTVRSAIFWMVFAAILDGLCGLLLVYVIFSWSLDIIMPMTLLAACSLIAFLTTFIATQKGYLAGGLVMRYLANALIRHLPLSLQPIKNANHLVAGPVSHIMSVPAHLLHPIISGLITPFTVVLGAFIYQPIFGCLLLFIGLVLLFTLRLCGQKMVFFEQQTHVSEQDVIRQLDQFALHQPLIRRAGVSQSQHQQLTSALASQYQTQKQLQRQSLPFHLLFSSAIQIIFIALFYLGIQKMNQGDMPLSLWLAGMVLLARFIEPIWLLSHLNQSLRQAKQSIEQVESALITPELVFPYRAPAPENKDIRCQQLSFYNDEKKRILNNITVNFTQNTFTAIVGPSGAGKSTLLSLLARLQDPTQGSVSYGNKNLMELSQEALCSKRGVLLQDSALFRGSVRQNLTLENSNIDDREVNTLLSKLNFEDIPDFLNRDVGASGMALSGGQKQRLCIARLFLLHPDIILMDEPTASLDAINTASVISLITLAGQQTRIVVTHHPNLACLADNIVYMEDGEIIAQGSHAELMAGTPWYQQFIGQS